MCARPGESSEPGEPGEPGIVGDVGEKGAPSSRASSYRDPCSSSSGESGRSGKSRRVWKYDPFVRTYAAYSGQSSVILRPDLRRSCSSAVKTIRVRPAHFEVGFAHVLMLLNIEPKVQGVFCRLALKKDLSVNLAFSEVSNSGSRRSRTGPEEHESVCRELLVA
jgi:hypothetical protein